MESETITALMDDLAVLLLVSNDLKDEAIKSEIQTMIHDLQSYLESVL